MKVEIEINGRIWRSDRHVPKGTNVEAVKNAIRESLNVTPRKLGDTIHIRRPGSSAFSTDCVDRMAFTWIGPS